MLRKRRNDTFAWYSAANFTLTIGAASSAGTLSTKEDGVIADELPVTYTVTTISGYNAELTNDAGTTNYWYANGEKVSQSPKPVGRYYITAAWNTGTSGLNRSLTADEKNAVKGKVFDVVITPSKNVRLVKAGNTAAVETTNTDASQTIYVTVSADGESLTVQHTYEGANMSAENAATVYKEFAIRTNNEWGVEVTNAPSAYSGSTEYSKGQAVSYDDKVWVYKNNTKTTANAPAAVSDYWQEIELHTSDKINFAIGTVHGA